MRTPVPRWRLRQQGDRGSSGDAGLDQPGRVSGANDVAGSGIRRESLAETVGLRLPGELSVGKIEIQLSDSRLPNYQFPTKDELGVGSWLRTHLGVDEVRLGQPLENRRKT